MIKKVTVILLLITVIELSFYAQYNLSISTNSDYL